MGLALVTFMHNRVSVALAGLFLIFFLFAHINPASSHSQSELWSLGRWVCLPSLQTKSGLKI